MNTFNKYSNKVNELLSTGRNKSYFVAAVTVFFILLMSFVGIIPAYSSLAEQIEENTKRDEVINQLETEMVNLKSLTSQDQEKEDLVKRFEYVFPEGLKQQRIYNLVLDIAEFSNVSVDEFIFTQSDSESINRILASVGNNVKVQTISIRGEGEQDKILQFVNSIEESRLLLNITEFGISRESAESGDIRNLSYNMRLEFYYYQPPGVDDSL